MFKFTRTAGLAAVAALTLGASAGVSNAAVIYATSVDSYNQGTGVVAPRDNTANALGGPSDGSFLSLGLGGDATFSFGQAFGAPASVVEVTFGNTANHKESVDVFGINSMGSTFLGSITNAIHGGTLNFVGFFTQLKLVDTSEVVAGRDGFDVDSIGVTPAPVPLPAGGLLLLGALGGIAALRRRKSA